ncbi:enoyl-CoA hydratase [Aurantimonas sp. C2-6-R+9]|uniref:enoyl-CoA hydratase n=1 Tax=unclassified Aurantimonas TaxID=2638230 RepID=UPI002E195D07|nr:MULTISPECIES: enoyl-CoA hydratase [unclassified Aurantimonas]MEC5291313.1 enoyl-CoA hydratase [Aurantimonas sp. C2-3-R2]MEC5381519.1 enoyl-CoA hydratase [Aurantimonas sp. C2-6-R+9]MEC5412400.1 enoyl-CoA hydratase [Aurantimonas sp. C2-4-R8]
MSETDIVLQRREGRVAILTLNRSKALNALNSAVMRQLVELTGSLDRDPEVGAILITGSEKAFAAGADIKEMEDRAAMEMMLADWFAEWEALERVRTPMIAAVAGFALGGGCELAMMCDLIIAADSAKFGQPEIKLGIIPGMGGSQRLTRAVGKYKAMDMILTGRMIGAEEAERIGLVSRLVSADRLMEEALGAAKTIADFSKPATMTAKEATNRSFEVGLREGLLHERRIFHALFAGGDQKEGMSAFREKRPATFRHG